MSDKKKLVIWCGMNSYEYWDWRNYDTGQSEKEGGIGGSESWVIEMAPRFAENGYEVHVFNNCKEEIKDSRNENVTWHGYKSFDSWHPNNDIDILLGFRQLDCFHKTQKAKLNIALAEDTVFTQNPNYPVNLPFIDVYIALCPYHKEFMHQHHGVPKEKIWIGKNGVDLEMYDKAKKENKKEEARFFYSSSLDRGIDNLLQFIWPHIKTAIPQASLHIYYGFNNWEKSIQYDSSLSNVADPEGMRIAWIKKLIKMNEANSVHFHGRVNKWTLAQEQAKCSMHLYPGTFSETFCSTYLEAMAADAVVVTSGFWAGLRTAKAGVLIPSADGDNIMQNIYPHVYDAAYSRLFTETVIKLATDKKAYNHVLERQRKHVANFTWDVSFDEYLKLFNGEFFNEKKELVNYGFHL